MEDTAGSPEGERESLANELYWDSDLSVNRIAEELDLSRGALYALVRPLATGIPCPECDEELQYANRTARDRALLTCPGCGLEEEEAVVLEDLRQRGDGAAPPRSASHPGEAAWGRGVLWVATALAISATLLLVIRRRRT